MSSLIGAEIQKADSDDEDENDQDGGDLDQEGDG